MAAYENLYWWSNDGLRLHARDYPGGTEGQPPIRCMAGLTRSARDFDALAARLAGQIVPQVFPQKLLHQEPSCTRPCQKG